ncbi:MAG: DegT/DnrJ/EryC1/StrS aminotransferase family protein [Epsilonproteobacteria bacterium]|nr:DegT/DnrJ/EryC1/StrS aminotransferase family protein [Campylobacterota bacterium]
MKEIPFYTPSIDQEEKSLISEVLSLKGASKIEELEDLMSEYVGCKYAVSTSSWSAAMHLSMFALDLKRGDKILCSVNAFPTVAEAVRHFDAEPIFVDIDSDDFNMSPDRLKEALVKHMHKKLKAVIISHIGGQTTDLSEIYKIAKENKIMVIEDASTALGATYNGERIGNTGADIVTFGFSSKMKNSIGDAGIIATNNEALYERAKLIRHHAIEAKEWDKHGNLGYVYDVVDIGIKYDTSELDAAFAIAQLHKSDAQIKRRQEIAKVYDRELADVKHVKIPQKLRDHIYSLYIIKIDKNRDDFARALREKGIYTGLHYVPLHLLTYYKQKYSLRVNDFPVALTNYQQILSIPLYSGMSDDDVSYVCKTIKEIAASRV